MVTYELDGNRTICTIYGTKLGLYDEVKDCLGSLSGYDTDGLMLEDSYTGDARCHPDDTFNAEIGMEVAHDHAMEKYNEAKSKAIIRWIDGYITDIETVIENFNCIL